MIDSKNVKLVAFDLDGTLTQHRTKLSEEHRLILEKLSKKIQACYGGSRAVQKNF